MAKVQTKARASRRRRSKSGILPVQAIRGLIDAGHVQAWPSPLLPNQLQPASLDLGSAP